MHKSSLLQEPTLPHRQLQLQPEDQEHVVVPSSSSTKPLKNSSLAQKNVCLLIKKSRGACVKYKFNILLLYSKRKQEQ